MMEGQRKWTGGVYLNFCRRNHKLHVELQQEGGGSFYEIQD